MTAPRPAPVGEYIPITDFESRGLSVRVFRLKYGVEHIDPHRHRRSTQVYVALEGRTSILRDGVETILQPFEALEVSPGVVHAARAVDAQVTLMNISVPPLAADDQLSIGQEPHHPDLELPGQDSDIED